MNAKPKPGPTLGDVKFEIVESLTHLARAEDAAFELSEGLLCRWLERARAELERAVELTESKMGINHEAR